MILSLCDFAGKELYLYLHYSWWIVVFYKERGQVLNMLWLLFTLYIYLLYIGKDVSKIDRVEKMCVYISSSLALILLHFMKTYGPKEHLMWLPQPCLSSTILPALIPALIYSTPRGKQWLTLSSGVLSLMLPVTRNMQRHNFSLAIVTESSSAGEHTSCFSASFNVTHMSTFVANCSSETLLLTCWFKGSLGEDCLAPRMRLLICWEIDFAENFVTK